MKPKLNIKECRLETFINPDEYEEFRKHFVIEKNVNQTLDLESYVKSSLLRDNAVYDEDRRTWLKELPDLNEFTKIQNGDEYSYKYIDDFLRPSLLNFKEKYIGNILYKAKEIYGREQKLDFYRTKEEEFSIHLKSIREVDFYTNSTEHTIIVKELEQLLSEVGDLVSQYKQQLMGKINFNMGLGELVYFFYLLWDFGLIKGIQKAALMRFVEDHMTYQKKEVKKANKQLDMYLKRLSERGEKTSSGNELIGFINKLIQE